MKIDYDGLKRAIICSSLTQRQIAQLSGIHEQTISRFMCDKRRPRPYTVSLITSAIGMDPESFVEDGNE